MYKSYLPNISSVPQLSSAIQAKPYAYVESRREEEEKVEMPPFFFQTLSSKVTLNLRSNLKKANHFKESKMKANAQLMDLILN